MCTGIKGGVPSEQEHFPKLSFQVVKRPTKQFSASKKQQTNAAVNMIQGARAPFQSGSRT